MLTGWVLWTQGAKLVNQSAELAGLYALEKVMGYHGISIYTDVCYAFELGND